ncbi:MAG: DoxX family membrane protein [Actinomycetota bacterium]|nr:DoxX family membrane protein [Actinomycetota bacterium]
MLAVLFVAAAAGKLARPATTAAAFGALRIPRPDLAARAVPLVELVLAVLLVSEPGVGGATALAVLVGFTVVLGRALRAGIRAPCRCFGGVREVPLSGADVLRNAMLAVLAVAALGAGEPRVPSAGAFGLVGAVVGLGAAALGLARGRR